MTRFLVAFVFVTGASVMELEMAASRLLAPYFGTSQIVWANLIGLILIGLSLGYLLGGRLADRRPDGRLMCAIVLAAGVYEALLPLFSRPILAAMTGGWFGTPVTVILASFAAILAVFLPPVAALATVSPFAIRLATREVEQSGRVAGALYAASTAGSILGTFVPAFLTIPFLGTRETIALFAALQVATAAWGLALGAGRGPRRFGPFLWLLVPALAYGALPGVTKPVPGLLFEAETFYQYVQVVRQGGANLLVVNEGGGIQSIYEPGRDFTGLYTDDYALLPFLARPRGAPARPERAVVLGSAGGTILRLWDRIARPFVPMELEGVEIDPVVARLAAPYFGFRPGSAAVTVGDARVVLDRSRETYDLVVVDAYSHQLYIPFQLTTVEFFRSVRAHLAPGGFLALNVNASSPEDPLMLAFERTLLAAFPHVYVAKVRGPLNFLLVGALEPVSLAPLRAIAEDGLAALARPLEGAGAGVPADLDGEAVRALAAELLAAWRPVDAGLARRGVLLTDDRAPVEYLTNAMVVRAIEEALR